MAIKIPVYDSQVGMSPEAAGALMPQPASLPMAPMQSVEEAGIPGKLVAKAGDQLMEVSTAASARLNHGRAIKDFAAMDLHTRLGLDKLSNEIQGDPEAPPDAWGNRFEEGAAKIKDEARTLTSNPLALANYDKMWAINYPAHLQAITAKGNAQDSHNSGAAFEEHIPQYADLYAQATDALSRTQIMDTVNSYIVAAVKAGTITPLRGAKARMDFIPDAMKARVLQDGQGDPAGTLERLKEPEKYYPGLGRERLGPLEGTVNAQMHRVQNDNYAGYMKNILGATADNPVQGAVIPTEEEILPQIGKTLNVSQAQNIVAYVRGQKASAGTGQENKTDPQSYKAAATRLTDPDNPLTREEFLKNVETGEWKFDAKTYGGFLSNIQSRGTKLDKAADSAFKGELAFQKTQFTDQFGMGKEYYQTAVGQAWQAKNEGTLGTTSEEVKANLKEIFNNQMRPYQQDLNMGKTGPVAKPGIISRIGSYFGAGQGASAGQPQVGRPVMNNRTGQVENVSPAEYDLIMKNQGGGR